MIIVILVTIFIEDRVLTDEEHCGRNVVSGYIVNVAFFANLLTGEEVISESSELSEEVVFFDEAVG